MRALEGIRVLLVDDEADSLEITRVMLESEGARVAGASRAADALAMIRADPPDVVLCDISMPEQDGFWLLRESRMLSRAQGGPLPFAALTAHASAGTRDEVLAAGFRLHITKPAGPAELVKAVRMLARQSETSNDAGR
jgi:CheY-like chemotaxis protein